MEFWFSDFGPGEGDYQQTPYEWMVPLTHPFAWHHRAALSPHAGRGRNNERQRC